ncbi:MULTISPECIES: hypothetical protein [Rhodopseudomonas]|uniref:hypothetical protein n=1 Tax=Rhodopseudomonas TaxID=1073 RepID=UPI0009BC2404|nr:MULTISPECIES: hypothetical protein [Rhodopseudomonas]NEW88536.1 hypothetical protein [Rhodopseudomonas sp. WA056]
MYRVEMERVTIAAATLGLALALGLPTAASAQAQQAAPASAERSTDFSAQERARPPRRLPIYPRDDGDGVVPRYDPGRNAVRDCSATYVQEYRPSGTVIVPRMNCFWRRG